jgi:hypothetical protein
MPNSGKLNIASAKDLFYNISQQTSQRPVWRAVGSATRCHTLSIKEDPMGDKGSKDKARRENKKKPKLTQKERKKLKQEKKKNK